MFLVAVGCCWRWSWSQGEVAASNSPGSGAGRVASLQGSAHAPAVLPCHFSLFPRADEEPFLIFANRYYLRKLNLDGSNYTLLKQVRAELGAGGTPAPRGWDLGVEWALKDTGAAS